MSRELVGWTTGTHLQQVALGLVEPSTKHPRGSLTDTAFAITETIAYDLLALCNAENTSIRQRSGGERPMVDGTTKNRVDVAGT